MEHGQSGIWPVWSSVPHLLESTIDPIVSSGFKILCLNIFKKTRMDAGHTTYGSSWPPGKPASFVPSAPSHLVSLPQHGIQIL